MKLRDFKNAVMATVEEMNTEADSLKDGPVHGIVDNILRGFARQLKCLCIAAGDDFSEESFPQSASNPYVHLTPAMQNVLEVEKARKEIRESKRNTSLEERFDGDMVEVVGGPASPDGSPTFHPVDPEVTVGCRTILAGGVYKLSKNDSGKRVLAYDEESTRELSAPKSKKILIGD